MEYSPPPFFKQGLSSRARLFLFAGLSLALLIIDARFQTLVSVRQVAGTVLYPIQKIALWPRDMTSGIADYFTSQGRLGEENQQLKRELLEAAPLILAARQLKSENDQLRRLLDTREQVPNRSLLAQLLYDARDPFSRKVIIDRGLRQGVQPGQPVVDNRGVVGQVVRAFAFTSEVALVTNRDQTIPVQVLRNGLRAIAYGGPQAGMIELRFMAANADVQPGDTLVTSGLDGVYPTGLPVAQVLNVDRDQSAFARITCAPVAGVSQHGQVLVLLAESRFPAAPEDEAAPTKAKRKGRGG